jgi:hypothetical protein
LFEILRAMSNQSFDQSTHCKQCDKIGHNIADNVWIGQRIGHNTALLFCKQCVTLCDVAFFVIILFTK